MNIPKYVAVIPKQIGLLDKGRFVLEREHAAVLLGRFPEIEIERVYFYKPLSDILWDEEMEGKTVLFVRPGGFGDLLFLTPVFREMKRICTCTIKVSCAGKFEPALRENPDVDAIVPYPVPVEEWQSADRHVWLERILEDGEASTKVNAIDLIAQAAGVTLEDKTIRFELSEMERSAALECYPKTDKPRVGIQVEASALNRTYPGELLVKVAGNLAGSGCEVFLFGLGDNIEADPEFVNLSKINPTFRQSCAILATCDAVLAPDSSLLHVAGALGIPAVGLFGPFQSALRVKYATSVTAIDGHYECAPCHHHAGNGRDWPEGCPGAEKGKCLALANIDPKRIVKAIMKILSERDGSNIIQMP
jgi:ADP-heptose:LPS heptosyltransferase